MFDTSVLHLQFLATIVFICVCKMLQLQLQFWSIVLSFTSSMLQLQFKTNNCCFTIYFLLCCSCRCSLKRCNLCLADIVLCCCCSCSFEEALCLCHSLMTLLQLQFYTSICLLYTSPSPRDLSTSRMPSSA